MRAEKEKVALMRGELYSSSLLEDRFLLHYRMWGLSTYPKINRPATAVSQSQSQSQPHCPGGPGPTIIDFTSLFLRKPHQHCAAPKICKLQ